MPIPKIQKSAGDLSINKTSGPDSQKIWIARSVGDRVFSVSFIRKNTLNVGYAFIYDTP